MFLVFMDSYTDSLVRQIDTLFFCGSTNSLNSVFDLNLLIRWSEINAKTWITILLLGRYFCCPSPKPASSPVFHHWPSAHPRTAFLLPFFLDTDVQLAKVSLGAHHEDGGLLGGELSDGVQTASYLLGHFGGMGVGEDDAAGMVVECFDQRLETFLARLNRSKGTVSQSCRQ